MSPALHSALKAVRVAVRRRHAWRSPAIGHARRLRRNPARLLCAALKRSIRAGELVLIDAAGAEHRFGRPGATPYVTLRIHEKALHWRLPVNSQRCFGEAYMDGAITLEQGSIRDLTELAARNIGSGSLLPVPVPGWLRRAVRPLQQHNPIRRARKHAAHHYDLSERLYEAFLDSDRQYSHLA